MTTCELMQRRVGNYWHCMPEYEQARKALWNGINAHTGKRRIDEAFPPEIRKQTNDHEMFIRIPNGSTWQLIGSDRYNATVGAGPVGIVYSEWALSNPSAWAYHRPMLEENGGSALFITTPRGRNHAKAMFDYALADMKAGGRWFAELSTIDMTRALSKKQLKEALEEYITLYGEDAGRAQYEQEYDCSFNAAILGAFYAREMVKVRLQGRIQAFDALRDRPVHRAWDIGVRDDTSIWWFQIVGPFIYVLDCYTASGVGLDHYATIVDERRKKYGWLDGTDFVPHDAKIKEWGTGRTRVETMRDYGMDPQLVPMATKQDGINAARITLGKTIFHERCEPVGVAALEQYRREWDDEKKAFKASEVRDWTTHLADAFRYLAVAWRMIPVIVNSRKAEPPPGYVIPPPPPDEHSKGRSVPLRRR